jgi:TPR repeat protein
MRGQARRYYERAAEGGYVEAMNPLGRMLTREEHATASVLGASGDAQAMANLGDMLARANRGEARQWYEQAAGSGSTFALRQLARMDQRRPHGSGRRYLEQAVALGDARAMALLAMAALRGRHGDEALALAEKAAAASKEEDPQKRGRLPATRRPNSQDVLALLFLKEKTHGDELGETTASTGGAKAVFGGPPVVCCLVISSSGPPPRTPGASLGTRRRYDFAASAPYR